jgi:hypothetical protein
VSFGLLIEVPLDGNGVPALQMPADATVDRVIAGIFTVNYRGHTTVLVRIGTRLGNPVFYGTCNEPGAKAFFVQLGAGVMTIEEARQNSTVWTWLQGTALHRLSRSGVVVAIEPPATIAGLGPRGPAVGDDVLDGPDLVET